MTTVTVSRAESRGVPTTWQDEFRQAIRDPAELCRFLDLPREYELGAARAAAEFPLFAPRGYVAKMRRRDPRDPLLRQVLPLAEEMEAAEGFTTDPLAERAAALQPGLIQKYDRRVLLIATGVCAVHCRYCFRRHFPYEEAPRAESAWENAWRRLAADETIDEVLLSGGDPLTLVDSRLANLAERIAAIPHIRRLRIHTRLPIVIPQRVTDELLDWLCNGRLAPYLVVHANHPRELDRPVLDSLTRLVQAGVVVLNQTVLLRGVNDNVEALQSLCAKLVDHRVIPYYVHQLDRVRGAAHFEVPVSRGKQLIGELRHRLPGYAVPRYVCEEPGVASKTVLA